MSVGSRACPVAPGRAMGDDGSILTEALVGIGMLGLITASVASLLPAALDAEVRASAHQAALMVGDTLLETDAAGIPPSTTPAAALPDPVRIASHVEHSEATYAVGAIDCDALMALGNPGTRVHVEHGGRTNGREVVLTAGPRIAIDDVERPGTLVVRVEGRASAHLDALVLLGPDGQPRAPRRSGQGCQVFDDPPSGTSWMTGAPDGPLLIDPLHVPLADRPIPVSLEGRPHDRTIDASSAGWLRVTVDHGSARPPDHVAGGPLRWFVRGDDANLGTALGDLRPVHPGVITALVPPCVDATTIGSSATVTVDAGEEVSLVIPLAVVTIEGIRGHTDAWLQLQRSTGCADGTGLRPVIRFEGALHDGIRIALPRGEWDAWLRRPASSVLTGSVRLVAVGTDGVVRIP